jgi:hypothetical protein
VCVCVRACVCVCVCVCVCGACSRVLGRVCAGNPRREDYFLPSLRLLLALFATGLLLAFFAITSCLLCLLATSCLLCNGKLDSLALHPVLVDRGRSDDGLIRGWRGFGERGRESVVTGWKAIPEQPLHNTRGSMSMCLLHQQVPKY